MSRLAGPRTRARTSITTRRAARLRSSHELIIWSPPDGSGGHTVARVSVPGAGDGPSTMPSRCFSRRPVSSSARYSDGPAVTSIAPSALPPVAVATPSPSPSQLLPTFGAPASTVTPSATMPGTAHLGSGKSVAISSAAVHDVRGFSRVSPLSLLSPDGL